jgi:hypothetical protein
MNFAAEKEYLDSKIIIFKNQNKEAINVTII